MKLNELFDRILFYLSVPTCVGCGERLDYHEKGICTQCRYKYENQKDRNCSRCLKPISECSCSTFYLENRFLRKLSKVYRYIKSDESLISNRLIYSLKQDNRSDVFEFLSDEVLSSIYKSKLVRVGKDDIIITNIPRRRPSIAKYGYDHSAVLAKRIAGKMGVPYMSLLVSKSKQAQKELVGEERQMNVDFDYIKGAPDDLKGKTVVIVDDIVTTGSSMAAAAMLIHGLGAKRIVGAVIAIAYKDSYRKFEKPLYEN